MHFYYDLEITRYKELDETDGSLVFAEKELVFKTSTYDFPKVDEVPVYIDHIIKEPCILTLKDYKDNGYHKIVKMNRMGIVPVKKTNDRNGTPYDIIDDVTSSL